MTNIFRKPDMPAALANPPIVSPPATMPSPDSSSVIEAGRREKERLLQRANTGGRASTILTGRSATPSADSYASPTL